jgi:hypothetical protein
MFPSADKNVSVGFAEKVPISSLEYTHAGRYRKFRRRPEPSVQELGEENRRVGVQDAGDLDKLDHIDPAVARFHTTDEGMRAFETRCQISLREASLLSCRNQNGNQCAVSAGPQGLSQGRSWQGALLQKWEQKR